MESDGMDADGTGDGGGRVDEGMIDPGGGEERRKWGSAKQHVKAKKMTFAKVKTRNDVTAVIVMRYRNGSILFHSEAEIL